MCFVSSCPYCGGLQENSTNASSWSNIAGYIICMFSGPTQMAYKQNVNIRKHSMNSRKLIPVNSFVQLKNLKNCTASCNRPSSHTWNSSYLDNYLKSKSQPESG